MKKNLIFPFVLAVCFIFLPQSFAAATLTVCVSGCDHTTIQAAIGAAGDGDIISVLDPVHTEAGIVVDKDLTFQGQGRNSTFVQGADTRMTASDRIFTISSGVAVNILDMTIRHGNAGFSDAGGGLFNDGGTLTLIGSTISDNDALEGGGLRNVDGTVELVDCSVSENYADLDAGGISNVGGILTLINSKVNGNVGGAGVGGGIANDAVLILINSSISNNDSDSGIGGGIYNTGTATLTGSTVNGNSSFDEGPGILNHGTLTLSNSTVSGNFGFGIENYGSATITSSTINDGLAYCVDEETVTLSNSIVSRCGVNYYICVASTEVPPIISSGYNLFSDETCIDTPASGDQIGVDPLLGSLQNNGGPTETHALLPGSPAINAIPVENCVDPKGSPLTADQRGVVRPQGSGCDIGAYEYVITIEGILIYFDEAVETGTIVGDGPRRLAKNRLKAFRNKIVKASHLISYGKIKSACRRLLWLYGRCDGLPKPKDFVAGPAALELVNMIDDFMDQLECE